MKLIEPDIEREFPCFEVPIHQVLLSFNSDEHAIKFHEWWNLYGWKLFKGWYESDKELDSMEFNSD